MDTGLGGWAANHADRLARPLAGTSIGLSSLAADGKSAQVPNPAVALDALEAFEVHADFPAQVAFDDILAVLNRVNDLGELLLGQILGANAGIDFGFGEDVARIGGANAVN